MQVGAARGAAQLEARPLEGVGVGARRRRPTAAPRPRRRRSGCRTRNRTWRRCSAGEAAPEAKPEARAEAKAEPAKPRAIERPDDSLDFIWPVKGKVLAGFSEPNSKGVDIGGKAGDPVVAAAAGRCIYIGTGIRGFGKLIVIRHENGFSSVYAHNREILVKEGPDRGARPEASPSWATPTPTRRSCTSRSASPASRWIR